MPLENYAIVGNRIPTKFFITQGSGESDNDIHTGSYHLALREARIEGFNMVPYSSVLPADIQQVTQDTYQGVFGEVMEYIVAQANCNQEESATAGIAWAFFSDKKTDERKGGFACEYGGPKSEAEAEEQLRIAIKELHANGYENFTLQEPELRLQTVHPRKRFGTALVALCMTEFRVPIKRLIRP